MENPFDLTDKVVVVTGSSGDIGKSIVNSFLNANAIVYGFDQNNLNEITSKKYSHILCNLMNLKKFRSNTKKIFAEEAKIDVLINNAGITIPASGNEDYLFEDWEKTIHINLTIPFFCSQIIKHYMIKNKRGSIINITSISAELGFPNNPAYGASKGGLKALSKSIASEYAEFGIRVNCVAPGYIGEE